MASVDNSIVRPVWRNTNQGTLTVHAARGKQLSILRTTEVSVSCISQTLEFSVTCLTGHRQIQSLNVRCENKQDGCSWEGELRSMQDHLKKKCPYQFIQCPLACGSLRMRANMDKHMTDQCPNHDTDCPDCGQTMKYSCFMKEHKGQCPYALEQCPAPGCDMEICSLLLLMHTQTDCQYTMVKCKYKNTGCHTVLKRGDMEEHEKDDRYHLQILSGSLARLQKQFSDLELEHRELKSKFLCQHNELKVSVDSLTQQLINTRLRSLKIKVDDFLLTDSQDVIFQVTPNSYNFKMELNCFGGHILVRIAIQPGENNHKLKWPFQGKAIIELLNQLEDSDHYTQVIPIIPQQKPPKNIGRFGNVQDINGRGIQYSPFIPHDMLMKAHHKYFVNNTVYFRIVVQSALIKHWLD